MFVLNVVLAAAALKKIMDKETQELIVRVKNIVAVYTGKPSEADDLEQNALKIIMKGKEHRDRHG